MACRSADPRNAVRGGRGLTQAELFNANAHGGWSPTPDALPLRAPTAREVAERCKARATSKAHPLWVEEVRRVIDQVGREMDRFSMDDVAPRLDGIEERLGIAKQDRRALPGILQAMCVAKDRRKSERRETHAKWLTVWELKQEAGQIT